MTHPAKTITLALALLPALFSGCAKLRPSSDRQLPSTRLTTHDFARWEKEISAYEQSDRTNPPPKNAILFIGSSTIRLWNSLPQDFPNQKIINRGFGGSEIVDSTHFADRLIFPHQPRIIFLRAAGNDIHNGKLPDEVCNDFVDFVNKVHSRLPRTQIVFIGLCPAPARWNELDKNQALNNLVRQRALTMPRVSFVDCWGMTLTPAGQTRHELFVDDKLHFNAEGYKLLADRVRPFVEIR